MLAAQTIQTGQADVSLYAIYTRMSYVKLYLVDTNNVDPFSFQ